MREREREEEAKPKIRRQEQQRGGTSHQHDSLKILQEECMFNIRSLLGICNIYLSIYVLCFGSTEDIESQTQEKRLPHLQKSSKAKTKNK